MQLGQLYTRIITLGVLLLTQLCAWADDDIGDEVTIGRIIDPDEGEMLDNVFLNVGFNDILVFALIVLLYFILDKMKVKKGCWYSILYCAFVFFLITKCT